MKSTNALSDILASSSSRRSFARDDIPDYDFNTLRDPRIASTSDLSQTSSSHHPDLSNEVATLSSKLVQAINNQTSLDDTLSATRQELENAQERVRTLELENDHFRHEQATGVWVKKADAQQDISRYRAEAEEEKLQRSQVEKEKKNIEQELENLTAELFNEANKVSASRRYLKYSLS
jgi:Rab guanine nucleotide exchange factor SEC2